MSLSESVRYSREFMLKAVERLEAGERASALAIELNLQRTIIYHWRDRLRANGAEGADEQPRAPAHAGGPLQQKACARHGPGRMVLVRARAQIAELERKVGQQQLDLDFFRGALQHIEGSRRPSDGPGVTASSPTSRQ